MLSHEAVRAVISGGAELGVIAENTPAEGLQTVLCEEDELVLIAPAGHPLLGEQPVRLQDVLSHELVGMNMSTSLMRQINGQASLSGQTARLKVQVRGFDTMCKMVAAGVGVAILPHLSALPLAPALGLGLKRIEISHKIGGMVPWMIALLLLASLWFYAHWDARYLVLLLGGLFLITKSTREIHEKLEGEDGAVTNHLAPSFVAISTRLAAREPYPPAGLTWLA